VQIGSTQYRCYVGQELVLSSLSVFSVLGIKLGNYCERLASCTSRLGISFAYGAGPDERRRRRRNEEEEESFLFVSLA
jgi:hypothetical protein